MGSDVVGFDKAIPLLKASFDKLATPEEAFGATTIQRTEASLNLNGSAINKDAAGEFKTATFGDPNKISLTFGMGFRAAYGAE